MNQPGIEPRSPGPMAGARGVMVIVVRKVIVDTSSNPERGCLHLTERYVFLISLICNYMCY